MCPDDLRAEEDRERQEKQPISLVLPSSQEPNVGRRLMPNAPAPVILPPPTTLPRQYVGLAQPSAPSQDLSSMSESLTGLTHNSFMDVPAAPVANIDYRQQRGVLKTASRASPNKADTGAIRRRHSREMAPPPSSHQERSMHDTYIAPLLSPPPEAEIGRFRPIRLRREDVENRSIHESVRGLNCGSCGTLGERKK